MPANLAAMLRSMLKARQTASLIDLRLPRNPIRGTFVNCCASAARGVTRTLRRPARKDRRCMSLHRAGGWHAGTLGRQAEDVKASNRRGGTQRAGVVGNVHLNCFVGGR